MLQLHIQSPLLIILHDQLLIVVGEINLLQALISTTVSEFVHIIETITPFSKLLQIQKSSWCVQHSNLRHSSNTSVQDKARIIPKLNTSVHTQDYLNLDSQVYRTRPESFQHLLVFLTLLLRYLSLKVSVLQEHHLSDLLMHSFGFLECTC